MPTNILITGGAGFIGCAVSRLLLDAGHTVTCVDNLHPQVHAGKGRPARLPDAAILYPADVTHQTDLDAILSVVRPEVIVHLAAETGTGQSLREATRHGSVNVVGTTQLLDALVRAEHVPEHIVLSSSRAVYGEGAWESTNGRFLPGPRTHEALEAARWLPSPPDGGSDPTPCPNCAADTEPRPANVYAATKLAQEHILGAWTASMGAALTVLRFQNVYGPGQSLFNSYTGVLTYFARQATAGDQIDVYEDGAIIRDFVYIDDVARSVAAAVARPQAGWRTIDIGSGTPTSIAEVARIIAGVTGAPEPLISGRYRDGDVRSAWADITAAEAHLGWAPKVTLEAGLRELVDFAGAADA